MIFFLWMKQNRIFQEEALDNVLELSSDIVAADDYRLLQYR
jgi:hypothetical protein